MFILVHFPNTVRFNLNKLNCNLCFQIFNFIGICTEWWGSCITRREGSREDDCWAYSALLLGFLSTERFAVFHPFVLAHSFWSDVSQIVLVQWQQEHTWFHCYPCSCVGEICGMFCSLLFWPTVHQGMRLVATLKSMSSLHQHSLFLLFEKKHCII